jgi:hypothetical protein
LKKRTKKLLLLRTRVFWFFFSKTNCFLSAHVKAICIKLKASPQFRKVEPKLRRHRADVALLFEWLGRPRPISGATISWSSISGWR